MRKPTITGIEIFKLNVPLKRSFTIALGTVENAENLVVKINTDIGLTGTGECSPFALITGETQATAFELAGYLAALIKGKNPLAIEDRLQEIDRAVKGNHTVKSAFDLALYDLLAQKAGMPLYRLLGGDNSREICTDMTVDIGTPKYMAAAALKFKEEGFPVIKVKVGTTTRRDVDRIRAIRKAVGDDMPIRIDANQGWDPATAVKTLNALEPFDIQYCEEPIPCWNNRELAMVRQKSPIPIMADESLFDHRDAFRLAKLGICDYFNIKLAKSGGIHNALKIIAIAETAGIHSQVGGMLESRYAVTALAHVAAARNNIKFFDLDSCFLLKDDPVTGGIQYKGKGKWVLPDTPGIGADFNPEYLKRSVKAVV
jgi:L-alanine-DL-glutamate epimerase-like enolase superfamily enzyme